MDLDTPGEVKGEAMEAPRKHHKMHQMLSAISVMRSAIIVKTVHWLVKSGN